jgi:hypothetical protein
MYRAHKTYEGMSYEKNHANYPQVADGTGNGITATAYSTATNSTWQSFKSYARPTNLIEATRHSTA